MPCMGGIYWSPQMYHAKTMYKYSAGIGWIFHRNSKRREIKEHEDETEQ